MDVHLEAALITSVVKKFDINDIVSANISQFMAIIRLWYEAKGVGRGAVRKVVSNLFILRLKQNANDIVACYYFWQLHMLGISDRNHLSFQL